MDREGHFLFVKGKIQGQCYTFTTIYDREFSYYSKTHNAYSRIDVLMVVQYCMNYVSSSTIESIAISDHAPISLTICSVSVGSMERTWSLNESILDDSQNVESLSHSLALYFVINTSEEVSDQVVLEAHKAVIKGQLISMGTCIYKKRDRGKWQSFWRKYINLKLNIRPI